MFAVFVFVLGRCVVVVRLRKVWVCWWVSGVLGFWVLRVFGISGVKP